MRAPQKGTTMQDDQQGQERAPLNKVQQLQFALLRDVQYNLFNGAEVVDDLLAWRDLWYAVIADRCGSSTGKRYEQVIDLIRLRDMPRGYWNVDYVFIWTSDANLGRLRPMIEERWQANVVDVLDHDEAEMSMGCTLGPDARILYAWWD